MPTPTTFLGLEKAVDGDNARSYLETSLGASLDTLDGALVPTNLDAGVAGGYNSAFSANVVRDVQGGTATLNFFAAAQPAGVTDKKFLWRMNPLGGGNTVNGDRVELSWMGADINQVDRWWMDVKVRQRLTDSSRWSHMLTDNAGAAQPITNFAIELDLSNASTGAERLIVVRNASVDSAAGDNQIMLDIDGSVGMQGIAQSAIAVAPLTVGPKDAVTNMEIRLADTLASGAGGRVNRAFLTRQTGANGDLLVRNAGTGNIVLRPRDGSANDFVVSGDGTRGFVRFGSSVALWAGSGAPGAFGVDGDFYFRSDGGAGTAIYQHRGGVWVATAA